MANNFNSTLANSILAQTAVTKVQEKLAYLSNFTTDFSNEVRDIRSRSMHVPFISGGSAVQSNPTDFESGDSYAVDRLITLNHISRSFTLTQNDLNNGWRLETLAKQAMNTVTTAVEAAFMGLLTESNFLSAVSCTAGAMTVANLNTLWGQVPGDYKVALLKDAEYKNLLDSSLTSYPIRSEKKGYGWDFLDNSNGFASAGAAIAGFGGNPAAIVMAAAVPEMHPLVQDLVSSEIIMTNIGLPIQFNLWGSSKTRQAWGSFDVLFGCAVGDSNAGRLLRN